MRDLLKEQKGKRWTAEARYLQQKDLARMLYQACDHAYLWHCGSGSEQAEKDCMQVLANAIEKYKNSIPS